jgi:hypothetical protein
MVNNRDWKIIEPYDLPPHISVSTAIRHLEFMAAAQGEVQSGLKNLISKLKSL